MQDIPKAFNASDFEDAIYQKWEKDGHFTPQVDKKKQPYCITMPPPNATGTLHLGHATMLAIEDILIRFKRMKGFSALWLPGTDHAAIATQSKVEEIIAKEGKTRYDLGREAFIDRVKEYVANSQSTIRNQVRKMGASCDWTRECYTLSDDKNLGVNEFFKRMYEDGLIYRGGRIVNWDPKMQTTVADDEVERKEETAPFYTFQYGPFEIGTARPETKFGDKYVVMHPDDERYKDYKHGDTFECEWISGKITATVLKDKAVDPEFGTGVMTITPWHDATDFDIAQRHDLDYEQIIDFDGNLLPVAGEFAGMHITEARPKLVEKLKEKGLLVAVDENYTHNLAVNYRGKGTIEPQIKEQWFVDVNKKVIDWKGEKRSIKEVMQDVVRSEMITILPSRFNQTYFHWIDNLRDWCISRQIWWGHQIPVWTCKDCGKHNVSVHDPDACAECGSKNIERDPDTLDTWFGVAMWTFSTLGWPEKTEELDYFHPTDVLETGYDILFFWVARMILASTYAMRNSGYSEEKSIPFKTVYLHGLVRDKHGRKMSKSLGNGIDPLDMIAKFGTDAVRLSLVVGSTPGNDIRLYEEKISGFRNFVNKIWNAGRFVLMNLEKEDLSHKLTKDDIKTLADKWILTRLNEVIASVEKSIDAYKLSEAALTIYDFYWGEFCAWYLEISKGEHKNPAVLAHVLKTSLKLLHPFIPFVTEALWNHLGEETPLIITEWPAQNEDFMFSDEAGDMQIVIDTITAIRSIRADKNVPHNQEIDVTVYSKQAAILHKKESVIMKFGKIANLTIAESGNKLAKAVHKVVNNDTELYIPLEGMVDTEAEKARTEKEMNELSKYIDVLNKKLSNDGFVSRAPQAVVDGEKEKLQQAEEKYAKLKEQFSSL